MIYCICRLLPNPYELEVSEVEENSLLMLLAPEMLTEAQERYEILREIHANSPVGRHLLIVQTKLSENTVRRHVEYMERMGLLSLKPKGMVLTEKGNSLLEPLAQYFQKSYSLSEMEQKLRRHLSMEKVIVLRGDADQSSAVKKNISQETAWRLMSLLKDGDVVAVGGGQIMAGIADAMPELHMPVDVLPACGGLGRKVEYLPNVVAARLAERVGGHYHIIHVPEGLPPELYQQVKRALPQAKVMDELFSKVQILVTGINDFSDMLQWQEFPYDVKERLKRDHAVGEGLGIFTDIHGKVLYRLYNAGITKEDIPSIPHVFIAAGGRSKGKAILAMARTGLRGTLITDEGAAEEILGTIGDS